MIRGNGMMSMGLGRGRGRRCGMGRGFGRGNGYGRAAQDVCTCPNCGEAQPHPRGIPCRSINCPKCGTPMVRG